MLNSIGIGVSPQDVPVAASSMAVLARVKAEEPVTPKRRLSVIVPAFNEAGMVGRVIRDIRKHGTLSETDEDRVAIIEGLGAIATVLSVVGMEVTAKATLATPTTMVTA